MYNHDQRTSWRDPGPFRSVNSSKTGLLDETRLFLLTFARLGDAASARAEMVERTLPQRSLATRRTVMRIIWDRLLRWNPPAWVLDDLAAFADDQRPEVLASALLLHVARQDATLYALIQTTIAPRWRAGETLVARADVQRFLDDMAPSHPEIEAWSRQTREKLAGNLLSIARDYGLLRGAALKRIVEPVARPAIARHVTRLLLAEGVTEAEAPAHPDWRLWLWDERRAREAMDAPLARTGA